MVVFPLFVTNLMTPKEFDESSKRTWEIPGRRAMVCGFLA